VQVVVWQQAPRCRLFGRYLVRAVSGTNVLRLPRRIGDQPVPEGTYRFIATSGGSAVLDVRIRVVQTKVALRIRHDDLADRCATRTAATVAIAPRNAGPSASPPSAATAPPRGSGHPFLPPHLSSLNPANGSPLVRAVFFAWLGCVMALLIAGALNLGKRLQKR